MSELNSDQGKESSHTRSRVFHVARMAGAKALRLEEDCAAGRERRPVFLKHSKLEGCSTIEITLDTIKDIRKSCRTLRLYYTKMEDVERL